MLVPWNACDQLRLVQTLTIREKKPSEKAKDQGRFSKWTTLQGPRYHWWVLSRLVLGNSICFFFVLIDIWEKKAWPPKKVTSPKTNDSKVRKFKILNPKMEVGGGWKMIFFSVSKKGLCFFFKVPAVHFQGSKMSTSQDAIRRRRRAIHAIWDGHLSSCKPWSGWKHTLGAVLVGLEA